MIISFRIKLFVRLIITKPFICVTFLKFKLNECTNECDMFSIHMISMHSNKQMIPSKLTVLSCEIRKKQKSSKKISCYFD